MRGDGTKQIQNESIGNCRTVHSNIIDDMLNGENHAAAYLVQYIFNFFGRQCLVDDRFDD
jgi:hypothetical protein